MKLLTSNLFYFISFLYLFFSSITSFSQELLNLQGYDMKPFHFGFTINANFNSFLLTHSEKYLNNDSIKSINPLTKPGVGLGMLVNFRLEEYFDVRVLPTVSFYKRDIEYKFRDSINNQKIESVNMEIPVQFKYKSERRENFRMYVIAGAKYGIDMASKAKVVDDTVKLKTKNQDFSLEWGLGMDFYNPMFKFSPEIKWSQGILNVYVKGNSVYSDPLLALLSTSFIISFHFE
ncbi:MAG: hypothetical protein A3H98_02550 [Bacteroidetes bacterium RIFCSPLOWO2_02_FULL_36_8]|nr:MAG: hypothetical protein A3H98_02550 [Bacteroidetes bacterium RIFCSPLOWO2_02_FULL_36_8]OFY69437.1 MAG: hypothetical protein A3G23_00770 [Bacteroidetes bacterium RIFCSPLOWO2_12_FULL_37_12]